MSQILDNICKLRDVFSSKDYKKVPHARGTMQKVFEEVHRNMTRKARDYNYTLDFTSQDLRELAQDIRSMLKRSETAMNPEKNIKEIHKNSIVINGQRQINIDNYMNKALPIMEFRRDNVAPMIELLNLIEYHSVYLYYLELVTNDEVALTYTERLTN